MNFPELVVHEYLSQVLGLLSLPQMKSLKVSETGTPYGAEVDFLALDFGTERILLVEVTARQDYPGYLVRNIKDRTPTFNWHVRTKVLKGKIPDEYRLVWLLIVQEKHVAQLKEETVGYPCEVLSLESILQHENIKKKLASFKDICEWVID